MNATQNTKSSAAQAGARSAAVGADAGPPEVERVPGSQKGPEARWEDVRPPMERRNEGEDPPAAGGGTYSAEASRQGYIVLSNPTRRWVFVGGLIAVVIALIVIGFLF